MKKRVFWSLFLCGCALSLSFFSCTTSLKKTGTIQSVFVTNTKKIYPLLPSAMDGTLEKEALFSATFGNETLSARTYLYADQEELSLLLFNDFGVSMGTLLYDGQAVSLDSAYLSQNVKGEYIILDFQNAFYKSDALRELYKTAGLSFETDISDGYEVRTIKNKNTIIEEIFISREKISITNVLRGYAYDVVFIED